MIKKSNFSVFYCQICLNVLKCNAQTLLMVLLVMEKTFMREKSQGLISNWLCSRTLSPFHYICPTRFLVSIATSTVLDGCVCCFRNVLLILVPHVSTGVPRGFYLLTHLVVHPLMVQ